jgi:Protein of unknown function (DUF5818)
MTKTLLLVLSLLMCTGWLLAQEDSHQGMNKGDAMSQTNVEGCLQGSNGSFTLTDTAGKMYQLQGDSSQLGEHVGHEVRVAGIMATAASDSMSNGGGESTLQVKSLKHISKTCKSGSKMKK